MLIVEAKACILGIHSLQNFGKPSLRFTWKCEQPRESGKVGSLVLYLRREFHELVKGSKCIIYDITKICTKSHNVLKTSGLIVTHLNDELIEKQMTSSIKNWSKVSPTKSTCLKNNIRRFSARGVFDQIWKNYLNLFKFINHIQVYRVLDAGEDSKCLLECLNDSVCQRPNLFSVYPASWVGGRGKLALAAWS